MSAKLQLVENLSQRQVVEEYLNRVQPEPEISAARVSELRDQIKQQLIEKDAVLIAHYYTDPLIQALAEETGGVVSDSLEMARFGKTHSAQTLVVAGVKFMGETAKILTPEKRVLMPTLEATCSLDVGCPADEFAAFCDQHPDRTVVVYANTSAAVKARADWVVTSSIALEVVDHLDSLGEKILWAPDKYLGSYVQKQTGADMLLWDGACIVHEEFKASSLLKLKENKMGKFNPSLDEVTDLLSSGADFTTKSMIILFGSPKSEVTYTRMTTKRDLAAERVASDISKPESIHEWEKLFKMY